MLMLSANMGDGLLTFTPIYWKWYLNITASSTGFFSTINWDTKVYVCTDVYILDDQVVVVEPTTERIPVIDLPVTLSCPWSASTKMFRYNPSHRGSGNLSLISSWKYDY